MSRRVAAIGLFVAFIAVAIPSLMTRTAAEDAAGCEGLADYRSAMFAVGHAYFAAVEKDGIPPSRDLLTFSSEEWSQMAEHVAEFQKGLKGIAPPSWAAEWHQTRVERAGIVEQMARAAASNGVLALFVFEESADKNEAAEEAARAKASAVCGEFVRFQRDWDALDGEIDGTPVATPTD